MHLGYAEVALKYGKNTYIDKTFTPDYESAKKIFDIAKKYGTRFFSTSALRFADELTPYAEKAKSVSITGGGSNPEEYIVHQIEMLVKLVGLGADGVVAKKTEKGYDATVSYPDGRIGKLSYAPEYPFVAEIATESEECTININSPFLDNLLADILRFLGSGEYSFDTAQTLEVMKIREDFVKAIHSI